MSAYTRYYLLFCINKLISEPLELGQIDIVSNMGYFGRTCEFLIFYFLYQITIAKLLLYKSADRVVKKRDEGILSK